MSKIENHVLYRFYSADDELLYIGITNNPLHRWHTHAFDKTWFSDITRATLTHYPTRAELVLAERHAIQTETPRYNKDYAVIPQPPAMRDKVQPRARGSLFGSDANKFGRPDAIADEEDIADPLTVRQALLERQSRYEFQLHFITRAIELVDAAGVGDDPLNESQRAHA